MITIHPIANDKPVSVPTVRPRRSCEELGICQGRYPRCGQCDDEHPEDDEACTPWDSFWFWLCVAAIAGLTIGVGIGIYWWATS